MSFPPVIPAVFSYHKQLDQQPMARANTMSVEDLHDDNDPTPSGQLALQTVAMPADTNATGDIFGGWLVSQMDLAGACAAADVARGRVATVAIDSMSFMVPVKVGSVVSCYTEILNVGHSSIQVGIEVWMSYPGKDGQIKVTDGTFVFVAIDESGRTRAVSQ